jgi:hypothetical protein
MLSSVTFELTSEQTQYPTMCVVFPGYPFSPQYRDIYVYATDRQSGMCVCLGLWGENFQNCLAPRNFGMDFAMTDRQTHLSSDVNMKQTLHLQLASHTCMYRTVYGRGCTAYSTVNTPVLNFSARFSKGDRPASEREIIELWERWSLYGNRD